MKNFILISFLIGVYFLPLQAQRNCSNNLIINGNAEQGTPTTSHEDISNAVGFSPIWSGSNWAEHYPSNYAPSGFTPPAPADGNYVSCWIANASSNGNRFREGFKGTLTHTILPNSGTYNFTMDIACLGGWGNAEIAVYGVYDPNANTPSRPTGAFTPSNLNLFGPAKTVLLDTIPVNLTTYNHNKTSISINFNSSNFPASGITHFFITNSDNNTGGIIYTAFDNFCMTSTNPCSIVNRDAEQGTPTTSHEDISNAVGFSPIWSGSNWAEHYPSNYAPSGFTPPAPADGNYVSCWIANASSNGNRFREGFKGTLTHTILPNSGNYNFTMDIACLSGWGNAEIAVYGVYDPNANTPSRPTGAFTPSNLNLFGPSKTVLLGTIPVNLTTYNHNKTNISINFNSSSFPANGITHFFITNSDNNTGGIIYTAFDNFCITPAPCPKLVSTSVRCSEKVGVYEYTINTSSATGSIALSSSCGTFLPSSINLTGATSYTVIFMPNGSCGNIISVNHIIHNAVNVSCDKVAMRTTLPSCKWECPCDKNFYNMVNQGFIYNEDCPNDKIRPRQLQNNCDTVTWTLNGSTVGGSSGNSTFSFPHLQGTTQVCMIVTRTSANGKMCRSKFCQKISPRLRCPKISPVLLNLNAVPNPATTQVMIMWNTKAKDMPDNVSVGIYNSSGLTVKFVNDLNSHDGNTTIDILDLPTGLYYIKIKGEGYAPAPIKFIKK